MFEEAADDGADANAVREALQPRTQDGEAADDEVDFDAVPGGLVEGFNDAGFEQGVHFGDDVSGTAGLGVLLLAADEAEEAFGHGEGGDEQGAVVVDFGVGGEVVEDHVDALGDLRIAGEQAEVGVEAGGVVVVVAGAEVAVAAGLAVLVAADEHGQLAMGFESDHAVEDLDAGIFHVARPADVGGLVEAGHEFDDEGGFLGGRGLSERQANGRVVAGAVEGLLHGQDGGVFGALLDEVDDRVVGVVGVMEQDVVLTKLVEDVGGLAAEVERFGGEGGELEVGAAHVAVEEHETREVDGAFAAQDLVLFQLKVDAEALDDLGIGGGFDFQADGVALAAIVELDADGFQQGAGLFLLEVEVGVAGDAEGGVAQDLVAAVHAAEVLGDEVLEQQVIEFAVGRGQADEAGQRAGDGNHAEDLGAGAAALGAEQQGETESLVEDAGKGVSGVNGDGGQEGIDLALEVALGVGAGLFVEFLPDQQADAVLAQLGEQFLVPAAVLGGDEFVDFGGEHGEGLIGAQAVVTGLAVAVLDALHEAGLAHLDVFVEVVGGDGEELDAFQQGVGGVLGFLQDAAVELHPGVVPAVEELLFVGSSGHRLRPVRRVGSLQRLAWERHVGNEVGREKAASGNS